jgi:hypothetical protein
MWLGRLDFGPVASQWSDHTVECGNAICGPDVWGHMTFIILGLETTGQLRGQSYDNFGKEILTRRPYGVAHFSANA